MARELSYGLSLAGGIITVLVGVLFVIVSLALPAWMIMMPQFAGIARAAIALFGVWGVVVGIILLLGANMLAGKNKERARQGSMLVLIFGTLGLVTLQGFVIGPIIAIIGGAIAVGETSKK